MVYLTSHGSASSWGLLLLFCVRALSATTKTITETHITATNIATNRQHGEHAIEPATPDSEPTLPEFESFGRSRRETPLELENDKRAAQDHSSGLTALELGAVNSSMIYLIGTTTVAIAAGGVVTIDGAAFSLDTLSRTLYATGSPYYVPISIYTSNPFFSGISEPSQGPSNPTSNSSTEAFSTSSNTVSAGQNSASTTHTDDNAASSQASIRVSTSVSSTSRSNQTSATPSMSENQSAISSVIASSTTSKSSARASTRTSSTSTVDQTSAAAGASESQNMCSSVDTSSTTTRASTSIFPTAKVNQTPGTSGASGDQSWSSFVDTSSIISKNSTRASAHRSSTSKVHQTSFTTGASGSSSIDTRTTTSRSTSTSITSKPRSDSSGSVDSSASSSTTAMTSSQIGTSDISASGSESGSLPSANTSTPVGTFASPSTASENETSPGHSNSTSGVTSSTELENSVTGTNSEVTTTSLTNSESSGGTTKTVDELTSSGQNMTQSSETAMSTSDGTGTEFPGISESTTPRSSESPSFSDTATEPDITATATPSNSSVESTTPENTDNSSFVTPLPMASWSGDPTPQEVTLQTGEWRESAMGMSCKPPCTMTLPAISLNSPATILYPAITASICTPVGSQIYRYVTTISVDPATITDVSLQPLIIDAMTIDEASMTTGAEMAYPPGSCSMALPSGDLCDPKRPPDSTDGQCGTQIAMGCPGMQCCGPLNTCGTSAAECKRENGCQGEYGACWLSGQESFTPLSEVFPIATDNSACPLAILPTNPTDGPAIAGMPPGTSSVPASTTTSGVLPPPGIISVPRLCVECPMKPPKWKLDLSCRGPLCKHIGPGGGGCLGICDLFKCHIGCKKKGGGNISDDEKPPPDPEDPEDPTHTSGRPPTPRPNTGSVPTKKSTSLDSKSISTDTGTKESSSKESTAKGSKSNGECETIVATQVTELCNMFTQVTGMSNESTLSTPRTTCTSTRTRVTRGCEVTPGTTTVFSSCTRTQTATDFTKFCTESVSGGVTYTPCTRTASTVFEGCSVTATTTSVIDSACQARVTFAPDDPQGEFGTLPAMSSNETCPFFPGLNVTVLDDQGSDGQKQNDTCQVPNGTRTSIDDDQGDGDPNQSCGAKNGTMVDGPSCPASNDTLVQGPDGAEDGIDYGNSSCPLNNTIVIEPDGAMDNDTAPSCGNATLSLNVTLEQGLSQGEDGVLQQSCALGSNGTLEIDNEQGEDGVQASCPIIPEGMILSPLADLGDYAPANGSCPLLDSRFPISWLDEQGDDLPSTGGSCPVPNITVEVLPDDPGDNSSVQSSDWSSFLSEISQLSAAACEPPQVEGLGRCSLAFGVIETEAPERLQTIDPGSALTHITLINATSDLSTYPWSCSCAFQTSGQPVVDVTTVCGTRMCPNFASEIDITLTTTRNTDPLYTFSDPPLPPPPPPSPSEQTATRHSPSDCQEPYDPNLGQCTLITVGIHEDAQTTTKPEYCVCNNQGDTTVELSTGCNGGLVCPNQYGLVDGPASGVLLPEVSCLAGLPSLSFLNECGLTSHNGVNFCTCNDNDRLPSVYYVQAITRPPKCGGYLCPNSAPLDLKIRAINSNGILRASTATALDSLEAFTTGATPGSMPTAARPTRATDTP